MFGLGSSKTDRSFYEAFERHAACIVRAVHKVLEAVKNPARAPEFAAEVRQAEQDGDKITHDTIARLHRTWITPIDQSDIHALIVALDDVLDLTEAVTERLALYELDSAPDFVVSLAEVLVQAVQSVDHAVRLLPQVRQPKEMLDVCVEINRLENEADDAYRRALALLFKGGYDAFAVLKWRDVIDNLEAATDRCEDVANILEGIVLEYS
jgi:predicted phosphate transport protein (TIGR00153 family)